MWGEWMEKIPIKITKEDIEEYEKKKEKNRKRHSLKHKIIDAKDRFAFWLLEL